MATSEPAHAKPEHPEPEQVESKPLEPTQSPSDLSRFGFTSDLIPDPSSPPTLAIKNNSRINRTLATHSNLSPSSYSAYLRHVQYGLYRSKPACLLALDFTFRFPSKSTSRFSSAEITLTFTHCSSPSKPSLPSPDPTLDPIIANFAPTEEGQAELHGYLAQDDEHDDGANSVAWDMTENPVSKGGIFRSFRGVVVLHLRRPGEAFWLKVDVKPVVKFSLDPKRLFAQRLIGKRDDPILLDGKTTLGDSVCHGYEAFDAEDFPWDAVLKGPGLLGES
ncbi:hypothetical protein B0T21DRAFT_385675 [Apiosordaria backusii]|uniref:Uncharacterized protein n=1 Tax=Apiosordaria backusii TaxID=314023 RepID=A0AA40B2N6_9PEZI|nr:hypothetical protein B0T21DRAFT_385675 [Apiosordaria backusii]